MACHMPANQAIQEYNNSTSRPQNRSEDITQPKVSHLLKVALSTPYIYRPPYPRFWACRGPKQVWPLGKLGQAVAAAAAAKAELSGNSLCWGFRSCTRTYSSRLSGPVNFCHLSSSNADGVEGGRSSPAVIGSCYPAHHGIDFIPACLTSWKEGGWQPRRYPRWRDGNYSELVFLACVEEGGRGSALCENRYERAGKREHSTMYISLHS